MKNKNQYQERSRKRGILNGITGELHTKNNVKNSAIETGKDLIFGAIGGGIVGAVIGKPSMLVGLAVSAVGHYTENKIVTTLGLGMMASSGFINTAVNGTGADGVDGIKERVVAFKDNLLQKTYLDKVLPKKTAVSGLGNVQYFTYPNKNLTELDMTALNNLEQQVAQSANSYSAQVNGGVSGFDEERIY